MYFYPEAFYNSIKFPLLLSNISSLITTSPSPSCRTDVRILSTSIDGQSLRPRNVVPPLPPWKLGSANSINSHRSRDSCTQFEGNTNVLFGKPVSRRLIEGKKREEAGISPAQLGSELSYDPKILKIGNVIKQESEKERNSYDFQNNSRNRSSPKFKKNS